MKIFLPIVELILVLNSGTFNKGADPSCTSQWTYRIDGAGGWKLWNVSDKSAVQQGAGGPQQQQQCHCCPKNCSGARVQAVCSITGATALNNNPAKSLKGNSCDDSYQCLNYYHDSCDTSPQNLQSKLCLGTRLPEFNTLFFFLFFLFFLAGGAGKVQQGTKLFSLSASVCFLCLARVQESDSLLLWICRASPTMHS